MQSLADKINATEGPPTEEVPSCPLCGSSDAEFLFWNFDRRYRLPGEFGTISCRGCGLIRLSPRPTVKSIDLYYPENYGAYEGSLGNSEATSLKFRLRDAMRKAALTHLGYHAETVNPWQRVFGALSLRLFPRGTTYGFGDFFPRYVKDGRALEVGCGSGRFLNILKNHGWNVQGIDLSPVARDRARELFDIDVFLGQVEEAPFENDTFDYVHLSHVVEHFFDPVSSMKKIKDMLKPNGTVYIEVPNSEGISAEISGKYWYGWDAPRHLFTFSPASLTRMVSEAGLRIVKTQTLMGDLFDWSMTFKYEEESGEALATRPMIRDKDKAMVNKQRREARHRFSQRPDSGDSLSYVAVKPA
jgi:SAM-dependent methyltransferase